VVAKGKLRTICAKRTICGGFRRRRKANHMRPALTQWAAGPLALAPGDFRGEGAKPGLVPSPARSAVTSESGGKKRSMQWGWCLTSGPLQRAHLINERHRVVPQFPALSRLPFGRQNAASRSVSRLQLAKQGNSGKNEDCEGVKQYVTVASA
jgi:hypothetical protein